MEFLDNESDKNLKLSYNTKQTQRVFLVIQPKNVVGQRISTIHSLIGCNLEVHSQLKKIMEKLLNILLVEDNDTDAFITTHMLKNVHEDCKITRVKNGKQALEYMLDPQNSKPDLIITDLNMPVMSGKQMLERILKNDNLRDIEVAVLTSSGNYEDIDDCLASGAKTCIEKPLNQFITKELIETFAV